MLLLVATSCTKQHLTIDNHEFYKVQGTPKAEQSKSRFYKSIAVDSVAISPECRCSVVICDCQLDLMNPKVALEQVLKDADLLSESVQQAKYLITGEVVKLKYENVDGGTFITGGSKDMVSHVIYRIRDKNSGSVVFEQPVIAESQSKFIPILGPQGSASGVAGARIKSMQENMAHLVNLLVRSQ